MFQDCSITVLLVDDNETNRYIIAHMLRDAGFNSVEAATGEDGLQLIGLSKPDLIILEVKLPDLDGFEVCKRLKANPETASIPVLHLSANFIGSRDRARGLDSGADAYLIQPVEPVELIATIKALLRIRQAEAIALTLAREWQITFNAIHDGVGLLNDAGMFIRCNESLIKLFGKKSSDELVGHLHQDFIKPMLEQIQIIPFYRAQETQRREELEINWQGRWYFLTIDPIYDNLVFAGAVLIIADITERKQSELKLQEQAWEMSKLNVSLIRSTSELDQRNQELDRFVYVVSHDLKAPLRAISNLTQWIEDDLTGQLPEENQTQMVLLRQRVHRLESFIDGLLEYSRVGRTEDITESVDVAQLLDEIIDSLVVPDTFVIELNQMPKLITKRLLLQQVFANLLSNAIKHHDRPDGRIMIS
ncbi:hypothetical protein C7H19_25030 [Aphanothece hegewaldii CCALA 016]|uniref:histidine kinase n=1 Tax=Aphanothece hegewaldii CCALA 016 TaxID=2107694 RepID=A0A2T1LQD3_9CHRO|nr:response regulator [Aphanothece hegewaldii]PSF27225.1 hypothetical protein C7H19_25030 [Aphanothece hegewaldii CCALA 016]